MTKRLKLASKPTKLYLRCRDAPSFPNTASYRKQGAESVSQCKCDPGFYDALEGTGGSGGAPSCSECPFGGVGSEVVGAISVTACFCPAGWYLDEVARTCVECEAGTYKVQTLTGNSRCRWSLREKISRTFKPPPRSPVPDMAAYEHRSTLAPSPAAVCVCVLVMVGVFNRSIRLTGRQTSDDGIR